MHQRKGKEYKPGWYSQLYRVYWRNEDDKDWVLEAAFVDLNDAKYWVSSEINKVYCQDCSFEMKIMQGKNKIEHYYC